MVFYVKIEIRYKSFSSLCSVNNTWDNFVLLSFSSLCLSTGSLAKASSVGRNIVIVLDASSRVLLRSGFILPRDVLMTLK